MSVVTYKADGQTVTYNPNNHDGLPDGLFGRPVKLLGPDWRTVALALEGEKYVGYLRRVFPDGFAEVISPDRVVRSNDCPSTAPRPSLEPPKQWALMVPTEDNDLMLVLVGDKIHDSILLQVAAWGDGTH